MRVIAAQQGKLTTIAGKTQVIIDSRFRPEPNTGLIILQEDLNTGKATILKRAVFNIYNSVVKTEVKIGGTPKTAFYFAQVAADEEIVTEVQKELEEELLVETTIAKPEEEDAPPPEPEEEENLLVEEASITVTLVKEPVEEVEELGKLTRKRSPAFTVEEEKRLQDLHKNLGSRYKSINGMLRKWILERLATEEGLLVSEEPE
jgi:hypothetical protein